MSVLNFLLIIIAVLYLLPRFKKGLLQLEELLDKKAEDSQMELKIKFNFNTLFDHPLLKDRYLEARKIEKELSDDKIRELTEHSYWRTKEIHFIFSNGIIFLNDYLKNNLSFYPLDYIKIEGAVFGYLLGKSSDEPSMITYHNKSNGHIVLYLKENNLDGKIHILCDFPMREILQLEVSDDIEKYNNFLDKNGISEKASDGDVYKDELGEWQSIDFNQGYTIYETKYFNFHYKKLFNFKF